MRAMDVRCVVLVLTAGLALVCQVSDLEVPSDGGVTADAGKAWPDAGETAGSAGSPDFAPGLPAPDAAGDPHSADAAITATDSATVDGMVDQTAVPAMDATASDAAVLPTVARRLLVGRIELVGGYESGCSHGPGVDRWCAVAVHTGSPTATELWVLNISQALLGNEPKCDGTDPRCRRLTGTLFTGAPEAGPSHPTAHRFHGDLLLFHADASSARADLFRGVVHAWKPGWDGPRALTSGRGVLCVGHHSGEVAHCLENITPESAPIVQFDLHAGRVGPGPLPFVARITPLHPSNQGTQWRAGYTNDANYFAYSTGGTTVTAKETLFVMKSDDTGFPDRRVKVGEGIARFTFGADGKTWLYLRDYNYNVEGSPRGTLTMADFPHGENERSLLPDVGIFRPLTDEQGRPGGIVVLERVAEGAGTARILKDPSIPASETGNTVLIARGVASEPLVSPDLRFAAVAKLFDEDIGTSDMHVARTDGSGECALTTSLTGSLFGAPFPAGTGAVLWTERYKPATDTGEGWYATPASCGGKTKFSDSVDLWFGIGNGRVLFSEGDGETKTIKLMRFQAGTASSTSVLATRADRLFQLAGGRFSAVVYTEPAPGNERHLFARAIEP